MSKKNDWHDWSDEDFHTYYLHRAYTMAREAISEIDGRESMEPKMMKVSTYKRANLKDPVTSRVIWHYQGSEFSTKGIGANVGLSIASARVKALAKVGIVPE